MTLAEDIKAKHSWLKQMAETAHIQGRRPVDVPLTLQDGLDLAALLSRTVDKVWAIGTYVDTLPLHYHEIEVSKKTRQTSGAFGGDGGTTEEK